MAQEIRNPTNHKLFRVMTDLWQIQRNRFATAVIMKWLNDGIDFYTRLPYLSAYMGHSHFEETAYYVHLLPENLLQSKAVNWELFSTLIPEVEEDD